MSATRPCCEFSIGIIAQLARVVIGGAFLTANWSIYVWAVDVDRVIDASLGYFITPLFVVAFGVFLLHESIRPPQLAALGLGASAVVVLAFGFSAHGFQLGPIVGKITADLITTGKTDLPIEPFSIDRFQAPADASAASAYPFPL